MSPPRAKQRKRREKLIYNNYIYTLGLESNISFHYRCKFRDCYGRAIKSVKTGHVNETQPHNCSSATLPLEVAKEAALEKLKQLTLADQTVIVGDVIKKVLCEMPPEAKHLMPGDCYLRRKVNAWAKEGNVQVIRPGPTMEDSCSDGVMPQTNPVPADNGQRIGNHESIDQYSTSIAGKKKPTLFFLKRRTEDGRLKCVIEGHTFEWNQEWKGAKGGTQYQCREKTNGCPVTATVYEDKQYEVQGEHMHDNAKLKGKQRGKRWFYGLKRIDDYGSVLGPASLDDVPVFEGEATEARQQQCSILLPTPTSTIRTETEECEVTSNADDAMDDGNDFHADFVPESDTDEAVSNEVTKKPPSPKDAVKSGERCHVCGDVLLVSETLSTSAETFRKACRYLNITSDKEWFPDAPNSRFYTFCDSCTREITKIHDLYKKVEEIQSLIFTKVENVEKRIADAEIVDNWMADAPPSSAVRFESFRKQVLINYRNKLKLRREIRIGRKMGHAFVEVQPGTSANMFASNPTETDAFRKLLPTVSSSLTSIRTRSKSKQKENELAENVKGCGVPTSPMKENDNLSLYEDDGAHFNTEDSQDAYSETDEKEEKFWHKDPDNLLLKENTTASTTTRHDDSDYEGYDNDIGHAEDDESDPDYVPTDKDQSSRQKTLDKRTTVTRTLPKGTPKAFRRPRVKDIEFPDAVLTKDNRVFMEGVEILKLPPGSYTKKPEREAYSCGACGIIMPGFWKIRLHICGLHLGMFRCPICNKQLAAPHQIQRHIEMRHTEKEARSCEICERPLFGDEKAMNYHIWTHLSEEEKKDPKYESYRPPTPKPRNNNEVKTRGQFSSTQSYQCFQCGKTFPRLNLLKKHELTHSEVPTQCQFCGKFYAHQRALLIHNGKCPAREIIGRRLFPCRHCPISFKCASGLAKHLLNKHGEGKPMQFSCPKCPRKFVSKHRYKTHLRICTETPKPPKPKPPKVCKSKKKRGSRSRKTKSSSDIQPSISEAVDSSEHHAQNEYSAGNVPTFSGCNYEMTGQYE